MNSDASQTKSQPASPKLNGHCNGHATQNGHIKTEAQVLADKHRALIEASAIALDVAQATGYTTIPNSDEGRARLQKLGFKAPGQMLLPALHIPAHDVNGNVCAGQIRPDIPRNDSNGKAIKYESPKGARLIVDVPPMVRPYIHDPQEEFFITEGKRKADSAVSHGLKCVSIMGVSGWKSTNEAGGKTASVCWNSIALNGRKIVLAFDSDVTRKDTVQRQLAELKRYLESRDAIVRVLYLPDGPDGEKTGLDDFFARGGTVETLRDHISDELRPTDKQRKKAEKIAAKQKSLDARGLPQIELNDRQLLDELQPMAGALAKYNGDSPQIFHGVNGLVELSHTPRGELILKAVTPERLQVLAAKSAVWVIQNDRDGLREVEPPQSLCKQFLVSPELWRNIPLITRILTAPFVDRHFNICTQRGYYASEAVFLDLPENFTLPDTTPTTQKIAAAKSLLLDKLLGEVAFADQASRANAVGLMILPYVRLLIEAMQDGQTPLHLFDAPTQSSGKTYAATICLSPFCEISVTSDKEKREECEKEIFSLLVEGVFYVFVDNVKSALGSATLATAITTGKMRSRVLGITGTKTVDSNVVWVATSNNAQLDADIVSRSILIRLDTNKENPESREFSFNPIRYIAQNRPQVLAAILTLVRAWLKLGSQCARNKNPPVFQHGKK